VSSYKMISIAVVTAALLVPSLDVNPAAAGVDAGEVLASYPLTSLNGDETRLSSFRGEVVVVNFWASWCAPCRKELPVMDGWHAAWTGRGGRVVAISIDKEVRNARRFAEETNLSLTVLCDTPAGLARTLDIPSLPCTFLLDKNGNVVSVIRSSSPKELSRLKTKAESLLVSSRYVAGEPEEGGTQ
jgi:peroxiredoxin